MGVSKIHLGSEKRVSNDPETIFRSKKKDFFHKEWGWGLLSIHTKTGDGAHRGGHTHTQAHTHRRRHTKTTEFLTGPEFVNLSFFQSVCKYVLN